MSRFEMRLTVLALPLAAALWPAAVAAVVSEDAVPPTRTASEWLALAPAAAPSTGATSAASPGKVPDAAAVSGPVGPAVAPAQPPPAQAADRWYSLSEGRHLGLQLDLGAPEGAGLSVVFRPWWWARFNGGLAYNYIGVGMRGGVSVVPWHWAVTPSLNFDFGHYFSGDASKFATNPSATEAALLKNAAYDFASAQIGLEFGSQRSFTFYLRGGLVYLWASADGATVTAYAQQQLQSSGWTIQSGDGKLRALLPCVSLGFIFYVY